MSITEERQSMCFNSYVGNSNIRLMKELERGGLRLGYALERLRLAGLLSDISNYG